MNSAVSIVLLASLLGAPLAALWPLHRLLCALPASNEDFIYY